MADLDPFGEPDDGLHSRRSMLAALAAVPVTSMPLLAAAIANKPDPVFALIDAANAVESRSQPLWVLPRDEKTAAGLEPELEEAEKMLCAVVPQTRGGTLALAEHVLGRTRWRKLLEALKRELG